MQRHSHASFVLALAGACACAGPSASASAPAQTPVPPTTLQGFPAGRYTVNPAQTVARFRVRYLGVNHIEGIVPGATGTITIDPAHLGTVALDVVMPATAIATQDGEFDDELKGPGLFDVVRYPTIRFQGRKLVPTGPRTARIEGEVTMHGVTRPLLLDATFADASAAGSAAFSVNATGLVRRSDFGMTKYAPFVGDDVRIAITVSLTRGV